MVFSWRATWKNGGHWISAQTLSCFCCNGWVEKLREIHATNVIGTYGNPWFPDVSCRWSRFVTQGRRYGCEIALNIYGVSASFAGPLGDQHVDTSKALFEDRLALSVLKLPFPVWVYSPIAHVPYGAKINKPRLGEVPKHPHCTIGPCFNDMLSSKIRDGILFHSQNHSI